MGDAGTASWNALSGGSAYDNARLFAGYQTDAETGLFYVRNRYYHASMGRWTSWDPIGYGDGMGLHEYLRSRPMTGADPTGLARVVLERVEGETKSEELVTTWRKA